MKFTPLSDRVILEMVKESTHVGLIELPQGTAHERSRKGTVIAIGPKAKYCKIGDPVYVKSSSGIPIHDEKRELVLVGDGEVLAKTGG